MTKASAEVHHYEHEEYVQNRQHHRAEQASPNFQRSLSEHGAEQQVRNLAEGRDDGRSEGAATSKTAQSTSDFLKELGISKLKSNCPMSQRACMDHDDTVWWQLVGGNLPEAVREWVELQCFTECDDLKEAATVQTYPICVEAAVIFARGSDCKEGTGNFLSLVQMHKLIWLKLWAKKDHLKLWCRVQRPLTKQLLPQCHSSPIFILRCLLQ